MKKAIATGGAIVPDLPGCVSIGDTLEEVQENVKEVIALEVLVVLAIA